ncbi:MAG: hypothetical protein JXN60_03775, partial [Lentisphaerae bacterium]|nr:hypothetical protein [Lentisphaerota bacterium]
LSGCEWDLEETDEESVGSSDFNGIIWMYGPDISGWPQTVTLTAEGGGEEVTLHYDVMQNWAPSPGSDVNANCWVVFEFHGKRYASTFDYLRVGQAVKESPNIPTPDGMWRPSRGETVGFMVSGMCRNELRTVNERSNIAYCIWQ